MDNRINISGEIFEEVEIESERVSKKDVNKIISEEKKITNKTSKLDLNRFNKFIKQIKLGMGLLKVYRNKSYTNVPWRSIALITVAILYFINPFDVVPDILPFFGLTDDAILFATVFKSIQVDLEKYGQWKGINTEEYF